MTYKQNFGKSVVTQSPFGILNYQVAREIGNATTALVLMRLGSECGWSGELFTIQRDRIASDVTLSVCTVYREIKKLQDSGLLEVIHGNAYTPNTYCLNMKAISALATGGESAISDESCGTDTVHAEFLHEPILFLEQMAAIGHLSMEEVDAVFEYERLFGVPPVNEPRLGKFYSATDKKECGNQPIAKNATPKKSPPEQLLTSHKGDDEKHAEMPPPEGYHRRDENGNILYSPSVIAAARRNSIYERDWLAVALFAYRETYTDADQHMKYFDKKYLPEFTLKLFIEFSEKWGRKQLPATKDSKHFGKQCRAKIAAPRPLSSAHPVPAKRSDGNSEPTPAETAAEQMAKIEAFRRWWDKVLDDDDDDDE